MRVFTFLLLLCAFGASSAGCAEPAGPQASKTPERSVASPAAPPSTTLPLRDDPRAPILVVDTSGRPLPDVVVRLEPLIVLGRTGPNGAIDLGQAEPRILADPDCVITFLRYGFETVRVRPGREGWPSGAIRLPPVSASGVFHVRVKRPGDSLCPECRVLVDWRGGVTSFPVPESGVEIDTYPGMDSFAIELRCGRHAAVPHRVHVQTSGDGALSRYEFRLSHRAVLDVVSRETSVAEESVICSQPAWQAMDGVDPGVKAWLVNSPRKRGVVSEIHDNGDVSIAAAGEYPVTVMVGRVRAPPVSRDWSGSVGSTLRLTTPDGAGRRCTLPSDLGGGPVVVFVGARKLDELVAMIDASRAQFPWEQIWRTQEAFSELGVRAALWGGDLSRNGSVELQLPRDGARAAVTVITPDARILIGHVDGERIAIDQDACGQVTIPASTAKSGRLLYVVSVGNAADARRDAPWPFFVSYGFKFRVSEDATVLQLPAGEYVYVEMDIETAAVSAPQVIVSKRAQDE